MTRHSIPRERTPTYSIDTVHYRRARPGDARPIRALIFRVGINPTGLDWRRFLVAVDEQDRVIGCGQIKPHTDGTRELASIAVIPERQCQGIGKALITRLIEGQSLPLYLTCRSSLGDYYRQFGFRQVRPEALPPYFCRIWRFVRLLRRISRRMGELWVMIKE